MRQLAEAKLPGNLQFGGILLSWEIAGQDLAVLVARVGSGAYL